MDTSSHILFGVSLGGLAFSDPAVAHHPELAWAVVTGTVIGSNAPDFDVVSRLKGFSAYLRHHRGMTHSVPALFLWPVLIALPLAWMFHVWAFIAHLVLWIFAGVCFHVFLDWLNTYGVQCFRPFSRKWQHLDFLCLFDPFLFAVHLIGVVLWAKGVFAPGLLFSVVYGMTAVYIVLRALQHQDLIRRLRRKIGTNGIYHVIPSLHPFRWQFVVEDEHHFHTGDIRGRRILLRDRYGKQADDRIVEATKSLDGVRAFLQFAQRIHVSCREYRDGYEVSWSDVRFYYNRKLSFGVDVWLDRDLNVVNWKSGWRKKSWDPPFI